MKILIVQCSFLGDTILSTPVIAALKKRYPHARLSMMTTPLASALVMGDPDLEEVILFDKRGKEKGFAGILRKACDLRKRSFDRVYSLHRSYRTALVLFLSGIPVRTGFHDASLSFLYTRKAKHLGSGHAVLRNLSLVTDDCFMEACDIKLKLVAPAISDVSPLVRDELLKPGAYAVLAPGSAWKTKRWHWQGFADLSTRLSGRGLRVYLVGGKGEADLCSRIAASGSSMDLSGKVTLPETLLLMKNSAIVVCNDSMALHMASALKTPTVVVFCATSSDLGFGPWENPRALIVENIHLECRPCGRHGGHACPNKTEACMTIDAGQVMGACERLLDLDENAGGS